MYEQERIALEPCGCLVDKPTGLKVEICRGHVPEGPRHARLRINLLDSETRERGQVIRLDGHLQVVVPLSKTYTVIRVFRTLIDQGRYNLSKVHLFKWGQN